MNIILKQIQGKEDCLYLNVYTKTLKNENLMPVLVWIYGGGFQMGEASREIYSPDYFMMENVVLVTISYRLGPLGFLSLNEKNLDVPGNAGLKDQVLALKWVKRNCHFFGGNPDNITVFGESAGGGSTHYMMLTEQTRGLFHKAVIMSGSALAPWANIPQRNWAYRLAKATGYKGENIDAAVLEYLQQSKASSITKVADELLTMDERHERVNFSFGPTVEPYDSAHCVIPTSPLDMMRNCWGNDIPMLIGGNSFEGLLVFPEARKFPDLLTKLGDCEYLTPMDANLSDEKRKEYGRQLKETYFGEKEPSWDTILHYSDVCSYKYFWHGIHRTVLSRVHNATAPTYLYRFDFDSKHHNLMRIIFCGRKVRGTCHADDLVYLFFNAASKKQKLCSAEYKTIRRMVSILVQFAECADPNLPTEKQYTSTSTYTANTTGSLPNLCDTDSLVIDASPTPMEQEPHKKQQQLMKPLERWLPVARADKTFKCLNISDELQVIDLPEADKLKLWDSMYEDKTLLY
ncbi:esterase B1 [Teleopsis dalmanni]|uniref:esterase B1 n=1 Tax=Teleopsis dalmanni TaxID=139649 RepID=UPI0018CDC00E|nr:esterase B1 [Teleopsis dalmanni]